MKIRINEALGVPENVMKENKSIWDKELYQKIKGNKSPITTKIKSKEEMVSELRNRIKKKL